MGLVAINQYHLTIDGQTMYAYGISAPSTNSWTLDGIAFYGCESSDTGAIPVYEFSAGFPSDNEYIKYAYAIGDSIGSGWYPEVQTNAAFYAYGSDAQGGVPVYNLQAIDQPYGTFYYLGNYPTFYLPVYSTTAYNESAVIFYALPATPPSPTCRQT